MVRRELHLTLIDTVHLVVLVVVVCLVVAVVPAVPDKEIQVGVVALLVVMKLEEVAAEPEPQAMTTGLLDIMCLILVLYLLDGLR